MLQGMTRNYVCHPYWMRGNRRISQDSSREELVEASESPSSRPHVPEPPSLPSSSPTLESTASVLITLPNYKRASNTSAHCIFSGCVNRSLCLIPNFIKRILLFGHNFYVPRSSRVCESHLLANEWRV